jgi:hypothetical protein
MCDTSDQCTVGGTCQPTGWCSFADATCGSGQRYSEAAGNGLAGICVGDEPPIDASDIDGPPGVDGMPDGMPDAASTCTTPFVESVNGCHGFFQPTTDNYDNARVFCQGMAADLPVIETLEESVYIGATVLPPGSSQRVWIGLDFRSGSWTWVDGNPLTFTNWAPNEPGVGENVAAIRPEGNWAGRTTTDVFYIVCEK